MKMIFIALVLMSGYVNADTADQMLVKSSLTDLGVHATVIDNRYLEITRLMSAARDKAAAGEMAGFFILIVTMKQYIPIMELHLKNIKIISEGRVPQIKAADIRNEMVQGFEHSVAVYIEKVAYMSDLYVALMSNNEDEHKRNWDKHRDALGQTEAKQMQAMIHFISAKQRAGLPLELTEFE